MSPTDDPSYRNLRGGGNQACSEPKTGVIVNCNSDQLHSIIVITN